MSTDKLYKTDGFCFTPLKCFDNFRHSHVRALGLIGLAALFDGLFQDDVLDLYGANGLGSPNLSQAVPFIKVFLPLSSQTVTGFPTYS